MTNNFPKSYKVKKIDKAYRVWIVNDFAADYGGLVAEKYRLGDYMTKEAAIVAANKEIQA